MSFLLDPGLLVASGAAIEKVIPEEHRDLVEKATIVTFLGVSMSLYMNRPGLGLFWKPFRAANGRDFMWNSGVLRVRTEKQGWKTHALALGIFATYPLWLRGGRTLVQRGRRAEGTPEPPRGRGLLRAPRSLAGFSAAVLPPEAGGPDPDAIAVTLRGHLRHAPRAVRFAVEAGAVAADGIAVATTGHGLAHLSSERRVAVLERIARTGPEAGAAVEGMKSLVVLAHGAGVAGVPSPSAAAPPARPDAVLNVMPSRWWPGVSRTDVIVIGSGAGGAMTARTLARSGLDVVIVEEGRRWTVDEFRDGPALSRFAELYRDGGTTVAFGRPSILLPIGRGVGGTTLVNSGTCFRPPRAVLERWRDHWGVALADPDTFDRHLSDVEATLQIAPVPRDVMGRNGRLVLDGAAKLGWSARPLVRNAPGCAGRCECAIGCPRNAKSGVHLNALPDACAHGARIISEARVTRILTDNGCTTGVRIRRPDGSAMEVRAPFVVVACGATESPHLLRRSGLGSHPQVGRNLTVHPAVSIAGRFDEAVTSSNGVLQSSTVEEFHDSDGILIEATAMPEGMDGIALPGFGAGLLREIAEADRLVHVGAMIADDPSGAVTTRGGQAVISYDLTSDGGARLVKAVSVMSRLLFAAGARDVLTGVPGLPSFQSQGELDSALADLDRRRLRLAAFHPAGTLRAGSDAALCPVDEWGWLRGVGGVWVTDASVLPTCPTVNPQVAIMAVALAMSEQIARDGGATIR